MASKIKPAPETTKDMEAPEQSGASSVVEGNEKETKQEPKKEVENKKPEPVIEYFYNCPFVKQEGVATVALMMPVVKDGVVKGQEAKKLKIDGGLYKIDKRIVQNKIRFKYYQKALKDAGFIEMRNVTNLEEIKAWKEANPDKPKERQKVFGLYHQEYLSTRYSTKLTLSVKNVARAFDVVEGQLFTDDVNVRDELVRQGWLEMGRLDDNHELSKEYKKKEE